MGNIFQLKDSVLLLGNTPFINASLVLVIFHKALWKAADAKVSVNRGCKLLSLFLS